MQQSTHPSAPASPARSPVLPRVCLLMLCSAYLQGALVKAFDFPSALAEMAHFGLTPAMPFALLTIVGELAASVLVISGYKRWMGALFLAVFTLMASLLANRFWELTGSARMPMENSFFEHLGLAGAFLLVAWIDFRASPRGGQAGYSI